MGYWLFGLVVLIETLLVIRGAVTIANWGALDSGWAQAIGSIIAIFAAFFLGERQAQKARMDAIDLVRFELRNRKQSILEIARAAKLRSDLVRDVFVTDPDSLRRYAEYDHVLIEGVIVGLESAPIYEIGNARAINDFLEIKVQCRLLIKAIDDLDNDHEARAERFYSTVNGRASDVRRRNIATHCDRINVLFSSVDQHIFSQVNSQPGIKY